MRSFDVEVETRVYQNRVTEFEIGDTVAFVYSDVSSKTEQDTRGAIVGYWEGYPVVLEDDWADTGTGTHRRLMRLHPDEGIVKVVGSRYVTDHPTKDDKLAWADRYRESDSNPLEVNDSYTVHWTKRGEDLGKFRFDVELEDPSKPQTRFSGVVIGL